MAYRFIKSLSKKQREDYMIMDDQYFSFDASSKIYGSLEKLAELASDTSAPKSSARSAPEL